MQYTEIYKCLTNKEVTLGNKQNIAQMYNMKLTKYNSIQFNSIQFNAFT
jgi:hypothetical protein